MSVDKTQMNKTKAGNANRMDDDAKHRTYGINAIITENVYFCGTATEASHAQQSTVHIAAVSNVICRDSSSPSEAVNRFIL